MHTARHTFATQSLLRGMPVEVLQKAMGHKRIQTTLVYAKVVEDLQHQTMRRVWEDETAAPGAVPPASATDGVCEVKVGAGSGQQPIQLGAAGAHVPRREGTAG